MPFEGKGSRFSTKQILEHLLCIKQYAKHCEGCTGNKTRSLPSWSLLQPIDKERYTQMSTASAEYEKWICTDRPGRKKVLSTGRWGHYCHLFTLSTDIYNVNNVLNLISSREMMANKMVKYLPTWSL